MIRNIIFDLGGVLIPEKKPEILKHIANEIGCTRYQLSQNLEEYDAALIKGNITLKEFYAKLLKRREIEKYPEDILEKHLAQYIRVSTKRDEEIINIIEKLKINYKVVALTNTEIEIGAYNREHGLFQYFDKAFLSTEMHMKKPDAEIYEAILKEFRCKPENAVFIDDKQAYIDGAKTVGIYGILYTSHAQLQRELRRLEVH